jgi:hypothetical protein
MSGRLGRGAPTASAMAGFVDFVDFVFIKQDCRCQPVPFPSQDRVSLASQIEHWAPPAVVQGAAPEVFGSRRKPGKFTRPAVHVLLLNYQNVLNRRTPPMGELGYCEQRNAGTQSPLHARPLIAPTPPPLDEPTMPGPVIFSRPVSYDFIPRCPTPATFSCVISPRRAYYPLRAQVVKCDGQ